MLVSEEEDEVVLLVQKIMQVFSIRCIHPNHPNPLLVQVRLVGQGEHLLVVSYCFCKKLVRYEAYPLLSSHSY